MPQARERMALRALDAYAGCGGSGCTTARTCARPLPLPMRVLVCSFQRTSGVHAYNEELMHGHTCQHPVRL